MSGVDWSKAGEYVVVLARGVAVCKSPAWWDIFQNHRRLAYGERVTAAYALVGEAIGCEPFAGDRTWLCLAGGGKYIPWLAVAPAPAVDQADARSVEILRAWLRHKRPAHPDAE